MPTPLSRKPALAAWIVRERKRLGLKPKDVADRLAAQGLEVSEATVKVWESNADRRPNPYNLEGLERIFDSAAPASGAATGDQSAVIAAIEAQTAMLEKVLTALQERTMDPSAVRALQEWAVEQATTRQQRQTGDPVSSPGQ